MILFGEINVAMFDLPWSYVHLASGLTIGAILATIVWVRRPNRFWLNGMALLVIWEMTEMTLRYLDVHAHEAVAPLKQLVGGFAFGPESTANTTGDLIIGAVGLEIGRRMGRAL